MPVECPATANKPFWREQEMLAARVFGSPTYVVDDERLRGHDRLEDLARRLKEG